MAGNLVDHIDLPFEPFAFSMLARSLWMQGNMLAYRDAFLLVALIFMLCLIPVWFMDPRKPDPESGRAPVRPAPKPTPATG